MAGLLQQGMQPQGGPQAPPQAQPGQPPQQPQQPQGQPQQGGQPPQGQPGQDGGDPRVDMDPEQGPKQRDQLVNAMLESLYGPMLERVKQIFQQHAEEPEKAIGRILAQLITVVWKSLQYQGKSIPPGVLVQAAMVAAQAVGEMAVRMRILPEEGNADPIESGFMIAMGEFGKATAKDMPPEQRKRFGELLAAIRDGRQQAMGGQGQPPQQGQPQGATQGGLPQQDAPQRDSQMPREQRGGV